MSTSIYLECDGCDAEEKIRVRCHFKSFNGKGHGFGIFHVPSIDDAVKPSGWVWADIIGCTYCPKCWGEIEEAGTADTATAADEDVSLTPNSPESSQ